MGNILQRNSSVDADVKTPQMASLTTAEVEIIKETWKIPSANVSAETCNKV
jgi:MinD superfamily P-loop ATPase